MLRRPVEPGVYTSKACAKLYNELNVTESMSGTGSSADNSLAESFNATLKRELFECQAAFPDGTTASRVVYRWARRCNTRHRHSAIGNIAPDAFEATLSADLAEAAKPKSPVSRIREQGPTMWGIPSIVLARPVATFL